MITRDRLSPTRQKAARRCLREHKLYYLDGWRPTAKREPLVLGTLIHAGIEEWWRTKDIELATLAVFAKAREMEKPRREGVGTYLGPQVDPFVVEKALAVVEHYPTIWPDHEHYEVVAIEVPFTAPLMHPHSGEISEAWETHGVIDLILRHIPTGKIYLVEHKSAKSVGESYWIDRLMDAQLTAYWLGAIALGYEPAGIIYDVAIKPGQEPLKATPHEKRKYRKDGALYASQREFDETPEEYAARIREAMADDPAAFGARKVLTQLEAHVEDGMLDAWEDAERISRARKLGEHPRNTDSCHSFGGNCDFFDICAHGVDPEFSAAFRRSSRFQAPENPEPQLLEKSQ